MLHTFSRYFPALVFLTIAFGSFVAVAVDASLFGMDFTDGVAAESLQCFNVAIFVVLSQEQRDREVHMHDVQSR